VCIQFTKQRTDTADTLNMRASRAAQARPISRLLTEFAGSTAALAAPYDNNAGA